MEERLKTRAQAHAGARPRVDPTPKYHSGAATILGLGLFMGVLLGSTFILILEVIQ